MSDLVELVAWLRQQIDEDERVARAAAAKCPAPWADRTDIDGEHPFVEDADGDRIMHHEDSVPEIETTTHIARHDPARVLADVARDRAILELHADGTEPVPGLGISHNGRVVRLLAQPYAGRPGWREEWAT